MAVVPWNLSERMKTSSACVCVGKPWGRDLFRWTRGHVLLDSSDAGRGISSHSCACLLFQVYQSLERELQRHVSRQDTLQQCQAWLSAVQPDLKPSPQPPLSRAEAVKQVLDSCKCVTLCDQSSQYVKYLLRAKLRMLLGVGTGTPGVVGFTPGLRR